MLSVIHGSDKLMVWMALLRRYHGIFSGPLHAELGKGLEALFYAHEMRGRAHANSVGAQAVAVLRR